MQTSTGVAVVDKADKLLWKMDGVKPLGWWSVTGIKGSAVLVSDGAKTRIVSTYNDQDLWTFASPGAIPSPAGPAVLLQRSDGWSLWEPLSGAKPIPNVAASATAAWEPNGQRVAIEASAVRQARRTGAPWSTWCRTRRGSRWRLASRAASGG